MSKVKPGQIAIITSLLLGITISLLLLVMNAAFHVAVPFYFYLVIFIAGFVITGFSFRILYGKYIFGNLNQIYRHIIRLRNPNELIRPMKHEGNDITNEINRILIDWSNESRVVNDHLK